MTQWRLATPVPELRTQLAAFLSAEDILDREIDRIAYASDASFYRLVPRIVVRPRTVEDVREIFAVSKLRRVPVTFRGTGTSLSGQAITDGILVDLSRHWRGVEPLDGGARVRVQPGVIGGRVNRALAPFGARIGPDPASIDACTMGGILSNNASGMCCGVVQNSYHTLESLLCVLPSGTVVDSARADGAAAFEASEPALAAGLASLRDRIRSTPALAARIRCKYLTKNTTGYSLNAFLDFDTPLEIFRHLLIGSEGTLAFIAEATLRTVPDLPVKYTGLLLFPSVAEACRAIAPLTTAGAAALELMDRAALRAVEDLPGVPPSLARLATGAAGLLVEFQEPAGADPAAVATRAHDAVATLPLVDPPAFTADPIQQALLWRIRKGMFPSVGAVRRSGTTVIIEDVAFPIPVLADAVIELQSLFARHGYADAIIFGHAKDGNLHFVLSQSFGDAAAIAQYERLMDDVVGLVTRHEGALKAEHGTGRNMAPFVEAEWGADAYDVMRRLKGLVDPDNLLNPGVIINSDPRAHVADLKSLPAVEEEVDRCIECGFCESYCPSRDLTLTPRQRIVVRREMARNPASRRALAVPFEYDGLATCAADGLCAVACPVKIDTGQLTKRLRAAEHSRAAQRIATWTARHFSLAAAIARTSLRVGRKAGELAGMGPLPRAAPRLPKTDAAGADAVYFPSCLTRTFGAWPSRRNASTAHAFIDVAARAGLRLHIPDGVAGHCCGTPYSSKGYVEAHALAVNATFESLWKASREGALPVLVDTSPCTYALRNGDRLTPENLERAKGMRIIDAVEYFAATVVPRLHVRRRMRSVTLHPVCSLVKMGLAPQLQAIASVASEEVFVPASAGCCGFAGDRGWLVPELTASATAAEAAEVAAVPSDGHYSSSRTCEIGLARATGEQYEHWIHLLVDTSAVER